VALIKSEKDQGSKESSTGQ